MPLTLFEPEQCSRLSSYKISIIIYFCNQDNSEDTLLNKLNKRAVETVLDYKKPVRQYHQNPVAFNLGKIGWKIN